MSNILLKLKDEKGQSLVEFALIVGLLLLILLGIVEFARAWYRADLLKGAANVAARTYAVTSGNDAAKQAAATIAANNIEAGMGSRVTYACADSSGSGIPCSSITPVPYSVTAMASENFQSVVPGLIEVLGTINIPRAATYRVEQ